VPNVVPGLLAMLSGRLDRSVNAEDLFAYLAAILAHPGYPLAFVDDLTTPGLRVPLTNDPSLFARATAIGRQVLWLHSYGQRLTNDTDRPHRSPRLPADRAPKVLAGASIPSDPDHMPDLLDYDPNTQELRIGDGRISNVTPRMAAYDVSGVNILSKWFSYRRKTRDRPIMGDRRVSALQSIQPDQWPADYTRDLIDLLNVIGLLIDVEPEQSDLLAAVCNSSQISVADLAGVGVLPVPKDARKPSATPTEPTNDEQPPLW